MSDAPIADMIDRHLVTIVNALRDGARPSLVAMFLHVPEWLVLRIGRDAHLLNQADLDRYEQMTGGAA